MNFHHLYRSIEARLNPYKFSQMKNQYTGVRKEHSQENLASIYNTVIFLHACLIVY